MKETNKRVLCHNCKYHSKHQFYSLCLFDDRPEETYVEPVYGKTIVVRRYANYYEDACQTKNQNLNCPNWTPKEPSKLVKWLKGLINAE